MACGGHHLQARESTTERAHGLVLAGQVKASSSEPSDAGKQLEASSLFRQRSWITMGEARAGKSAKQLMVLVPRSTWRAPLVEPDRFDDHDGDQDEWKLCSRFGVAPIWLSPATSVGPRAEFAFFLERISRPRSDPDIGSVGLFDSTRRAGDKRQPCGSDFSRLRSASNSLVVPHKSPCAVIVSVSAWPTPTTAIVEFPPNPIIRKLSSAGRQRATEMKHCS